MQRALVIEHERATPAGLIAQWLSTECARVEELQIDVEPRFVDPRPYDLIVSLGSEFPAYDDSIPFVAPELEILQCAIETDVPVLGVCFGGQLLARALGGRVFRAEAAEIGWLPLRSHDTDLVPDSDWFQWHFDTFTVPPTATVIAESDIGPQAFISGRTLGVQFHPEVTLEIMESWVKVYQHELDEEHIDGDMLLEATRLRAAEARTATWQLLTTFSRRMTSKHGES